MSSEFSHNLEQGLLGVAGKMFSSILLSTSTQLFCPLKFFVENETLVTWLLEDTDNFSWESKYRLSPELVQRFELGILGIAGSFLSWSASFCPSMFVATEGSCAIWLLDDEDNVSWDSKYLSALYPIRALGFTSST